MLSSVDFCTPCPIEVMEITDEIPIITPNMVKALRSLLFQRDSIAISIMSIAEIVK